MNKYAIGWISYYIGAASITVGTSIYADTGTGLVWGGVCMVAAGLMQVTLDK
jgi:hypothetical protein